MCSRYSSGISVTGGPPPTHGRVVLAFLATPMSFKFKDPRTKLSIHVQLGHWHINIGRGKRVKITELTSEFIETELFMLRLRRLGRPLITISMSWLFVARGSPSRVSLWASGFFRIFWNSAPSCSGSSSTVTRPITQHRCRPVFDSDQLYL